MDGMWYYHITFSGELKCGTFSEWFEPFVRDWIDDITHKVKQEISVIFEDCDLEQSIKKVNTEKLVATYIVM